MKVGDYVRFENGTITKINSFSEKDNPLFNILINAQYYNSSDIKVSSSNIIDLIEESDIIKIHEFYDVYGVYEVQEFRNLYTNEKYLGVKVDNGKPKRLYELKIVSIVTKEQFESMQYNLESEVN